MEEAVTPANGFKDLIKHEYLATMGGGEDSERAALTRLVLVS
jgi:hypothetical protein